MVCSKTGRKLKKELKRFKGDAKFKTFGKSKKKKGKAALGFESVAAFRS